MVEGRGERERESEKERAVSVAAVCCTRRMVYVSSAQGTIGGMGGREKTSDECIPRPARMRREHRAGGKGR